MTIEEEFFGTFHIYKSCYHPIPFDICSYNHCYDCEYHQYPEITAEKLLELICIVDNFTIQSYLKKEPFNFDALKNDVLERCLFLYNCGISKDELIQKVRKLFEEE